MRREVEKRIEQIRRGEVPEGYKKTGIGIVSNEWIDTCFGEIYTERKEPGSEKLPLLMVSIHSGVSDGEVDESERPKKVKRIEDASQYKRVAVGDLVFNMMRAWQGAIGTVRTEGMVSPAYIVAKPNDRVYPSYMEYYARMPQIISQIDRMSYGVTDFRKRLYWNSFEPIKCVLPPLAEQKKIAEILFTQDKAIELQQKKIEGLREFKRACLGKLFPRNGQSVPEVRFPGFNGDWEQRKFSELVQIERGGSPRPIDDFITDAPNGLNWVKIGDAPTQGNYITKTAEKIRPEGLSKTREVHPGDLILSNSMSFGKPYIMGIDGCIHDGWLLIRNTYGVFDLTFLCHLLGTPQMLSQYRSLAAGSTVNNLNKELVGNTVVTIPSITEQRVLGGYLEQLDNLITLHQRKLEEMKKEKKALMQLLLSGIVRVSV